MNKIKLKQTFPGSWDNIDIFVDGVERFHASKFGTDFWSIHFVRGNRNSLGTGSGRSGVKKTVKKFLSDLPDKNARYRLHKDGSIWKVWDGEDFTDDSVLLYNCETGEDVTFSLTRFHKYFEIYR